MQQRDKEKKAALDRKFKGRQRAKLAAIKLTRGCADCGYREHSCALDFDHLGNKSFTIGLSVSNSWVRLLEEVAKCNVVCANCHRVRTMHRRALLGGSPPPAVPTENW